MTLLLDAAGVTENTGGGVLWDLVCSPKQCGLLLKQVLVKKIILLVLTLATTQFIQV